MKIFKIKSDLPTTEYAPSWDISIGVASWTETLKIDTIREWLIKNEDRLKEMYPTIDDAGTGLGTNSLTSRVGKFDLFNFSNELPELNDLLNFLRHAYLDFVKIDYNNAQDLVLVTWINILKNNEEIKEHVHSSSSVSYLSANIHLDDYATSTIYRSPYDPYGENLFENIKGGLTIFPSYVPHKTTKHTDTARPRVSIACDLRIPHTVPANYPKQNFMSKEIFEQLILER